MKLPWVSRAHHEVLLALLETQRELITMLRHQNEELRGLFNKTSQFDIVEQTEQGVKLKHKPLTGTGVQVPGNRSGWRSRRAGEESQTVPKPSDSVQALEQRVAEQKAQGE